MDPNRQRRREYRRWQKKKEKDRGEGPFPSMPVQQYPFRPQKGFRRQGVVKGFADFYRDEDKRYLKGNALQNRLKNKEYKGTRAQKFPYGSRWDIDPDTWHEELGTFRGNKKVLPVQGPPHWTDIWYEKEHFGTDAKQVVANDKSMSDKHLKWLKKKTSSKIPREERISHLSDIKFRGHIGGGNSGEVWRVKARKAGIKDELELACKVTGQTYIRHPPDPDDPAEEEEDDDQVWANYQEMYALTRLSHPHIVKVEDIICIPDQRTGYPFSRILIFMELCGGTLQDIERHYRYPQRMSEMAAKHWFRQIASALEYLHNHNGPDMAHGDVKHANIFHLEKLSEQFNSYAIMKLTFKLGDFGDAIIDKQRRHNKRMKKLGDEWVLGDQGSKHMYKCGDVKDLAEHLRMSLRIPTPLPANLTDLANQLNLSVEVLELVKKVYESKHIVIRKVLRHRWLASSSDTTHYRPSPASVPISQTFKRSEDVIQYPRNVSYPGQTVDDRFRKFYRLESNDSDIEFPFGSLSDLNWNEPNDTFGQRQDRALFGPPNWSDIWHLPQHYGTDYLEYFDDWKQPVSSKQLKWLDEQVNANKSKDERISKISSITFLERFGKGVHSKVWLVEATNEQGARVQMACKVLNEQQKSDLFALRYVKHEYIVKVEDIICIPDQQTGYPFSRVLVFMELCDGTLKDLMNKFYFDTTMPEQAGKHWLKQIAAAVDYLHNELNMVQRDMNLGNIFYLGQLDEVINTQIILNLTFKLADFGRSYQFINAQVDNYAYDADFYKKEEVRELGSALADTIMGFATFNVFQVDQESADKYGVSMEALDLMGKMRDNTVDIRGVLSHAWVTGQ